MEHDRELLLGKEVESDFFVLIRHGCTPSNRARQSAPPWIRYAITQQIAPVFEQFVQIAKAEGLNVDKKVDEFDAEALGSACWLAFQITGKTDRRRELRCDLVHRRHVCSPEKASSKRVRFSWRRIRKSRAPRRADCAALSGHGRP